MTTPWTSDYPTPKCDAARERVFSLHRAYSQLVREQPTRERIEAAIREEWKATETGADEAASEPAAVSEPGQADLASPDEVVGVPSAVPTSESTPSEAATDTGPAPATTTPATVAEAIVPASSALPVAGALSERTLENLQEVARRPRAVAERNRLDKLRNETLRGRYLWAVALYVIGVWAVWGLGSALGGIGQGVVLKLGVAVPAPALAGALALVLAGLVVFGCWILANALQLHRMTRKDARAIPFVDTVGHIYEIECYHAEPLDEEQAVRLSKKLETLRNTLTGGKTPEEASEDLKLHLAFFGFIALVFAITNFLAFPHKTAEQIVLAVMLAVVPVAFVFFFTKALSNHTVAWPRLSEELTDPSVAQSKVAAHERRMTEAAAREAKAQAARAAAEAQAEKDRQARKEQDERNHARSQAELARLAALRREDEAKAAAKLAQEVRVAQERETLTRTVIVRLDEAQSRYKVETEDRYADLLEAAQAFEAERGYSKKEQEEMRKELKRANVFMWLLLLLSLGCGILATYPASLTINELFGLRDQFVLGNRVAIMPWALWLVVVLVAKFVIVQSHHRTAQAAEQHGVLVNLYDESERLSGLRYRLKREQEVKDATKGARMMLAVGLFLLTLEFLANAIYIVQNTDGNRVLGVVLALVPLTLFVALTWPHSENHHVRHKLRSALKWARALPTPSAAVDPNDFAPSRSARNAYEELTGYVDPASPGHRG